MSGGESTKQQEAPEEALFDDLTEAVQTARRGFRRDMAKLVEALPKGGLYVPLAESVVGIAEGETVEPESVSLKPHLLPDRDNTLFVALFTDPDILTSVGQYIEWTTDDGEDLQYCTLPAPIAIDLALQLLDDERIVGAVINPSHEHELVLRPHELGALSQSKAIPLVGYVNEIPFHSEEKVIVAELETPPAQELLDAIEKCLSALKGVKGYRLEQTFNAERDLEPHLSLTLKVSDAESVDTEKLNEVLAVELEGKLPEPGYIDVLFDTNATNTD